MLATVAAWFVPRAAERKTRRLMFARIRAEQDGLAISEDVVACDMQRTKDGTKPREVESST